jgi:hypothetical protein
MSDCRQTANLWFYIAKRDIRNLKWAVRSKYFWNDTFGCYLNRFLLCKLLGHRKVEWLSDGSCESKSNRPKWYCFNCQSEVDSGIDMIVRPKDGTESES